MKIAFTADDDDLINNRFGCAYYFQILTIENNAVTHREPRDKYSHVTRHGCLEHCEHPICFTPEFIESLKEFDLIVSGGFVRKP